MGPRPSNQPIPLYRRAIFVAVPVLVLALFTEGLLRLVDRELVMVRTDDPISVYRLYPGRHGVAAGPEYRVDVRTDELGLRTCETTVRADPGPADVFVLGDSFAEGWGVPCEGSFPELLARAGFSLRNGGVHGGTASFYILRLRDFQPRLQPKVLVVQLFDNDLDDLDRFAPFVSTRPNGDVDRARPPGLLLLPSGRLTRGIRALALFRVAKRALEIARGQPAPIKYYRPARAPGNAILSHAQALERFGRLRPLADARRDYNGQFAFYLTGASNEPPWRSRLIRMEHYLRQIVREARSRSPAIRILLVYIPAKEVFAPGGIVAPAKTRSAGPGSVARLRGRNPFWKVIEAVVLKEGISVVDGQSILREGAESLYYPGDAHLNIHGHRRLSAAIAPVIRLLLQQRRGSR